MAKVSEAGAADEADVTCSDHRNVHAELSRTVRPRFDMAPTAKLAAGRHRVQISWLYAPTWLRLARRGFTSSRNRARMSSSDFELSTTTTSSGLFEEARTRTQEP